MIERHIACIANGIGDSLCGLWALESYKEKFPNEEVVYYCASPGYASFSHKKSLHWSHFPKEDPKAVNVNEGYVEQIESFSNRLEWYCDKLSVVPKKPNFSPNLNGRVIKEDGYVVLAPFSCYKSREWALCNFLYLEQLLSFSGVKCVVIGDYNNKEDMTKFSKKANFYYGQPPEIVCNIVNYADLVITIDSMPLHLAAVLDTKCICIHSQIRAENLTKYYEKTISVMPKQKCSGCQFQFSLGYTEACDAGCFAMNTITPFEIYEIAKQELCAKK